MTRYKPRILDKVLQEYLKELPAICIDGAKGVGKTSTARIFAASEYALDKKATRELIQASPQLLDSSTKPTLIDEWQRLPETWDTVRRLVDENSSPNRFILTGSAYPADASIHSGSGRIVHLRMRPLSLEERQLNSPTVSIGQLLTEETSTVEGQTDIGLEEYVHEILKSGFPSIQTLSSKAAKLQIEGYIENIINKTFSQEGYVVKRPEALRSWLVAYAAATASTASYSTMLDVATPGETNKPSKTTTQTYRNVLSRLWLLDDVDPWLPIGTGYKYLGKTPKHFLVDPALVASLLDLTYGDLINGCSTILPGPQEKTVLGRLFESLVAQSLKTYTLANDARLRHFRNKTGTREVDFILGKGRTLLAIEVKLSETVDAHDVRHLHWLEHEFSSYKVIKCAITAGPHAYTRADGVHVIPAALLGA